ncbi:MAG: hypothetical protein Q7S80_00025 [bacterium]|nr:hypothetical protein [bacterium]
MKILLGEAGPSPDENFLWQVTHRGDKEWHLEIWLPERYRRKRRARAEPTTHILRPEQCQPANWWNAVAFGDPRVVFK